jgi:nucleotide-binding universal stress UspA family protein
MKTALICLRGHRIAAVLNAAAAALSTDYEWIVLHVVDSRPLEEVDRALGGLPVHGPRRHRVEERLRQADDEQLGSVQADVITWLREHRREAVLVVVNGRPETEILRIAEERSVDLIALGSEQSGIGPHPVSPPARFLIDHARSDILLLRRY